MAYQMIQPTDAPWIHFLKLFRDKSVTELLLKGYQTLSVVTPLSLKEEVNPFPNNHSFVSWVQSLARSTGVRLDPVQGSGGGQIFLSDGSHPPEQIPLCLRWHCVLPPISIEGPILSLRRHRFHAIKLCDFKSYNRFKQDINTMWHEVKGLLIAGPTGSGKTTFLSALLQEYATSERLVILETLHELPVISPHSVHLCERPPSIEGNGAVGLDRLIIESLRLRPDRLVFGEIRGHEAKGFCEALMMGHGAAVSTIHASSDQEACYRLFSLADTYGYRRTSRASQASHEAHHLAIGVIVLRRGNPPEIIQVKQIIWPY